jgi:hypothetical protein
LPITPSLWNSCPARHLSVGSNDDRLTVYDFKFLDELGGNELGKDCVAMTLLESPLVITGMNPEADGDSLRNGQIPDRLLESMIITLFPAIAWVLNGIIGNKLFSCSSFSIASRFSHFAELYSIHFGLVGVDDFIADSLLPRHQCTRPRQVSVCSPIPML